MAEEASIRIELTTEQREWIERQIAEGRYASVSELVGDLILHQQLETQREAIDERLAQALASGPPTPATKSSWQAMHRELDKRLASRREKRAG